jgi:hypothetical protein
VFRVYHLSGLVLSCRSQILSRVAVVHRSNFDKGQLNAIYSDIGNGVRAIVLVDFSW